MSFSINLFITVLTVSVLLFVLQIYNSNQVNKAAQSENDLIAQKAVYEINGSMNAFSYDVLFMASLAENQFLPVEQKFILPFIADIMSNYLVSNPLVDQVRLLSPSGMELVRVNETKGQAEIVAKDRLQNKSNRYYFRDVKDLASGSIFVSYLDLNIENGQVEIPVKPMIRLASPLHDSSGNFIGMVIINFKAQTMINRLSALGDNAHDIWLVNDKGDWLLAPENQIAWAGQLQIGGNNLKNYLPGFYPFLSGTGAASRKIKKPNHFYSLHKVTIKPNAMINKPIVSRADNVYLIISTDVQNANLAAIAKLVFANPFSFLVYFIGFWVAFIYSYQSYRKQRLAIRNRFQKNIITTFFDSAPEAMLVFNAHGHVVYENFKLTELLSELSCMPESGLQLESAQLRQKLWHDYRNNALPKEFIEVVCNDKHRFFRRKASWVGESDELLIGIVVSELTDVKQAEMAIEQFAERMQKIINAAPDGIMLVNHQGIVTLANDAAKAMFEMTDETLLGLSVDKLVPLSMRAVHKGLREEYQQNPRHKIMSERNDIKGVSASGRVFDVEISLSPMSFQGEVQTVCVIRDTSGRKRIERQLQQTQKMEALGKLTGGIAHDFNNLLTSIIGNLDLLAVASAKEETDKKQMKKLIDTALNSSLKAVKLTKRLLSFSRRQPDVSVELNIGKVLQDELDIIRSACGKMVDVKLFIEGDVWPVEVDPEAFTNAVINLCTNARDAMPEGGRIYLQVENFVMEEHSVEVLGIEIPEGEYVTLSVSDKGRGMEPGLLEKIFEPFYTTKPKDKGTGLGLSMVFGFVKQSNGYIQVYSELGIGTTFKIFLPRTQKNVGPDSEARQLPSLESEQNADEQQQSLMDYSGTESILMVDDEPDLLRLASFYLSDKGYTVHAAHHAKEALHILAQEAGIDLVVTDIVMPSMNGFELAANIKETHPDLPVIFCSGFPEEALRQEKLYRKNLTLIDKPYRSNELLRVVRNILDKHSGSGEVNDS